jgi:hypothetical protein
LHQKQKYGKHDFLVPETSAGVWGRHEKIPDSGRFSRFARAVSGALDEPTFGPRSGSACGCAGADGFTRV